MTSAADIDTPHVQAFIGAAVGRRAAALLEAPLDTIPKTVVAKRRPWHPGLVTTQTLEHSS